MGSFSISSASSPARGKERSAQWRMVVPLQTSLGAVALPPLRGCVFCSRGSLKVKLTFIFCHPEQCHPELVSGLFQGLQFDGVRRHPLNAPPKKIKTKEEIPDQARNDKLSCHPELVSGSLIRENTFPSNSYWRDKNKRGDAETRLGLTAKGKSSMTYFLVLSPWTCFRVYSFFEKNEMLKQNMA